MDLRGYVLKHKYPIGGAFLLIIIAFIISRNRSSNDNSAIKEISEISPKAVKMIDSQEPSNDYKEIKEIKQLIDIFTGELRKSSSSLIQFNTDRIKTNDYLNMRNNLFTRDIVATKLLVDSKSLDHTEDFNPAQFTLQLGGTYWQLEYAPHITSFIF